MRRPRRSSLVQIADKEKSSKTKRGATKSRHLASRDSIQDNTEQIRGNQSQLSSKSIRLPVQTSDPSDHGLGLTEMYARL